jgi:SET domain-containing protein
MLINRSYIAKSPIHGWGVFMSENVKRDEIIMQCVYKRINSRPYSSIHEYTFGGDRLVLGNASLINGTRGGFVQNVKAEFDPAQDIVNIVATQDIAENEELLLNY